MGYKLGSFAAIAAGLIIVGIGHAAVLIQDDFADGDRKDGDGLEAAWFKQEEAENLTIVNDDGAGKLNGGNALYFEETSDYRGFAGLFTTVEGGNDYGAVTLDEVGEALALSFRFRLTQTPNDDNAFRFGIVNNNGSQALDDGSDVDDDHGHALRLATGNKTKSNFYYDTSQPGILSGTGLSDVGASLGFGIGDTLPHEVTFTLTRISASEFLMELDFDGNLFSEVSTRLNPETFHGVGFASGAGNPDFLIDDVQLTYIPEPATAVLAGLGVMLLVRRRR